MPFTPSHAIVALPFVRTPLVPAAIAIGAMTPDLPLFVRHIGLSYAFTHANTNILWTALIALVLFVLWRVLLRPAVAELSPGWLARRIPADWSMTPGRAAAEAVGIGARPFYPLALVVSLVLGVISHIVWDLFTHTARAGVEWIPALGEMWGPLHGYRWLQYGSGVGGLIVLGICGLVWLRRAEPRRDEERMLPAAVRVLWWVSLPALLIGALVAGYVRRGPFDAEYTPQHLAYEVLPPACAVWGALTLVLCVVVIALRGGGNRGNTGE